MGICTEFMENAKEEVEEFDIDYNLGIRRSLSLEKDSENRIFSAPPKFTVLGRIK